MCPPPCDEACIDERRECSEPTDTARDSARICGGCSSLLQTDGPRCEGDEFLVRARHALAVGVGEADGDAADNERLKYASAALPLGHRSSLSRVLCTVAARSRGATASPCSGEARRRLMTREKEPKGARRDWAAKE